MVYKSRIHTDMVEFGSVCQEDRAKSTLPSKTKVEKHYNTIDSVSVLSLYTTLRHFRDSKALIVCLVCTFWNKLYLYESHRDT